MLVHPRCCSPPRWVFLKVDKWFMKTADWKRRYAVVNEDAIFLFGTDDLGWCRVGSSAETTQLIRPRCTPGRSLLASWNGSAVLSCLHHPSLRVAGTLTPPL